RSAAPAALAVSHSPWSQRVLLTHSVWPSPQCTLACFTKAVMPGIGGRITGYTRHGLHQAISREDVGVSVRAILEAAAAGVQHDPFSNSASYVPMTGRLTRCRRRLRDLVH